jgi:hypothetical protein
MNKEHDNASKEAPKDILATKLADSFRFALMVCVRLPVSD